MTDNSKTVVALLAGLAAGAALGILFAPESGEETVDKLSKSLKDLKDRVLDKAHQEIANLTRTSDELADKASESFSSVKEEVKGKIDSLKEDANDNLTDYVAQA
ncbi:YtxH domain-containing protein [Pedobacter ginsengiterrae]